MPKVCNLDQFSLEFSNGYGIVLCMCNHQTRFPNHFPWWNLWLEGRRNRKSSFHFKRNNYAHFFFFWALLTAYFCIFSRNEPSVRSRRQFERFYSIIIYFRDLRLNSSIVCLNVVIMKSRISNLWLVIVNLLPAKCPCNFPHSCRCKIIIKFDG